MAELRFRVMGSPGRITADGAPACELERAHGRLCALERKWSRFRAGSEVSRLNRAAGAPVHVSSETADLLRRAAYAMAHTDCRFNPFLLTELTELGYDSPVDGAGAPDLEDLVAFPSPADVVEVAVGRAVDPGGIGKGLAADIVATDLAGHLRTRVVVELGGDVRIAGDPVQRATLVEIQDPWDRAGVIGTLRLRSGGIATSTTLHRRWVDGDGVERHHLLDPETQRPAQSDLVAATVVAGEAWWAEVLAKAAVIGGSAWASALLERHHVVGVLVHSNGEVHVVDRPPTREAA